MGTYAFGCGAALERERDELAQVVRHAEGFGAVRAEESGECALGLGAHGLRGRVEQARAVRRERGERGAVVDFGRLHLERDRCACRCVPLCLWLGFVLELGHVVAPAT